nr:MAG TPA: hypothetical protein [Caudoviricetes sp.]
MILLAPLGGVKPNRSSAYSMPRTRRQGGK